MTLYFTANNYVYSTLKAQGAAWTNLPQKHFPSLKGKSIKRYKTLKGWSDTFKVFDNWINLNVLMSISSTFEIYLASIVSIAIQSDPGVLLGSSKSIDGVYVLKHGTFQKTSYQHQIDSCTKGDWNSRIATYEKLFGIAPNELKSKAVVYYRVRL